MKQKYLWRNVARQPRLPFQFGESIIESGFGRFFFYFGLTQFENYSQVFVAR